MAQVKVRFQETTIGLSRFLKKASKRHLPLTLPKPQDQDQDQTPKQDLAQNSDQDQDQPIQESGYVTYLVNDIRALLPRFNEALAHYHQSSQSYRKAAAHRRKLGTRLKSSVRDFWQVLKKRTRRLEHPSYILGEFTYPQLKTSPAEVNDIDAVKILAQTFISGDATLVQQGYPAMANPSAQELQTLLHQLQERQNVEEADILYQKAQTRFNGCTKGAILLQRLLNHTLQAVYAHLRPGQLRRLMSHYGFAFPDDPKPGGTESETSAEDIEEDAVEDATTAERMLEGEGLSEAETEARAIP